MALMSITANQFRTVFWFAVIPAAIAVLLLVFGVEEPAPGTAGHPKGEAIGWHSVRELERAYWLVVAFGAAFTLARFSEAFLILRAQQQGLPDAFAPLVFVVMNAVYAATAYPVGKLSDRMGHFKLLGAGLVLLIAADLVLALAQGMSAIALGVVLWGLHMGVTQGLLATMVAATAPAHLRGTAFGIFNLGCGVAMLIASVLAGLLWDTLGAAATFYAGAAFSAAALVLMGLVRAPRR